MNNTRLKELLNKYLDGAATAAEIREVDDWYQSFDRDRGLTEQLNAEQVAALEQLLFLRVSREIEKAGPGMRVIKPAFRYWWAAAGVAVLLALGGIYFIRERAVQPETAAVTLSEQTGRSSIKKIALPDGTMVWLNFDSKIRYAEQQGREVWLEGEGYFEVAPQQGKAFLVHAGKLDVRVLGTSFNIDAYTPGKTVTVTVAGGKVAVGSDKAARATLAANQQAVYHAAANKIETGEITAADFSAWRQGQLVFKKAMFSDIAQKLERRYNVRIRFAGEHIANALLTARFDENVPLKDVLDMLCDIYGFSYRQEPGKEEYLVYDGQPNK
ncbi:FecR domain-containing protein [Chitinophaga sp. YIM B06452]|uniref:FecR family protein n=1 Tax=Chitinophaga sp. YIM B06452 TaxID=3082158 RepID=UPI0031FF0712